MDKNRIREAMRLARDGLKPIDRRKKSRAIFVRVCQDDLFKRARTVLIYVSRGSEVSTSALIRSAWAASKMVCVPRVMDKSSLQLRQITSFGQLKKGRFGIMEPISEKTRPVRPMDVDLAILPGLAFDSTGHRLGYGGGYFDRLLIRLKNAQTIGLAFSISLVVKLPVARHDRPVDKVVTEKKSMVFSKK